MTKYTVVECLVKACRAITLTMKYVKELGYTQSTKVFDCPVCKTRALKIAQKKGTNPIVRAYKKVLIFKHPSEDITIAACPCGYRKIRKPKGSSNSIDAATQGMIQGAKNAAERLSGIKCGCGGDVPEGRTKFCYQCRPRRKPPTKEVDSQSSQKTVY